MFNMRGSEETTVLENHHWLCIESECEPPHNEHSLGQDLAGDLRSAMLAFQIWAPKGWEAIIVTTTIADGGSIRVLTVSFPEHYAVTRWARRVRVDDLLVDELRAIIDGTLWALDSDSVTANNPFQYLEIGLQTAVNHGKAGALLWMIGLDSLLAAQGEALFATRLCRLLGKGTRIFPKDYAGRSPAYTVGDLAADKT